MALLRRCLCLEIINGPSLKSRDTFLLEETCGTESLAETKEHISTLNLVMIQEQQLQQQQQKQQNRRHQQKLGRRRRRGGGGEVVILQQVVHKYQ